MNEHFSHRDDMPAEHVPVPTWVKVVQAAVLGLVAGLALNAIISAVGLRGAELSGPQNASPKQCKKAAPARGPVAPQPTVPSTSSVRWALEGQSAWLAPYELSTGN